MSVWLTIPSARPRPEADEILDRWDRRGYKLAIWRDTGSESVECNVLIHQPYPGYARAVNTLVAAVLAIDPECGWCVAGGDDTLPDPNYMADEIAAQCTEHFGGTFGVMQPTADRYAGGSIDRIAGSPWMGRDWSKRANGGVGPLWPEFTHMFGDQCLQETAIKAGVFWQRPDLIHLHYHFMRKSDAIDSPAVPTQPPAHLREWNTQRHWDEMLSIFKRLEQEGFRPCLPV